MIASDIAKRLSGGGTNTSPGLSLGGIVSSTNIVNNVVGNLFDNVTAGERTSGSIEYRCFYYLNTHPTETLENAVVFIQSNTPSIDTHLDIGLDPAGIGDGGTTGVAASIPDETTPPAGVDFDHSPPPDSEGTGLVIGDLGPGEAIALWVRRTVEPNADPAANDPATIRITGTPV